MALPPSLEESFRFVCPDGGLIAMLVAFTDESGTHGGAPVITVAMYIAPATSPKDYWARFRADWKANVLRNDPDAILHMKEIAGSIGRNSKVDEQIAAAVEAVKKHTIVRVATALDVAAYEQYRIEYKKRLPVKFHDESAYLFCAVDCLRQVSIWMDRIRDETGQDDNIVYIYEDGHKNVGGLRVFFDKSMQDPEIRRTLRLWTHMPETKKHRPELQAADFFAYWLREWAEAVDYRKETFTGPPSISALGTRAHRYNYYDAARLTEYLNLIDDAYKDAKARQDEYERIRLFERQKRDET